jgi:16S rRNA (adenine1518-N6/adenine1519-N6)-dimethyltransferase
MQTKQDIVAILSAAGLHPDRSLGQHFLIDGNLMRKLIESAEVTSDDVVLEVGGGTGGLSELLAETAGHLVVVEIDHDLAPILAGASPIGPTSLSFTATR